MDGIDFVVRAACIAAAVTIWVPIAHKVRRVSAGEARLDPLVAARPWLARRPNLWLSAAIAVELCVSVSLVLAPAVGAFGFAALCLGYASQLAFLAPEQDCECFGRAAAPTRRDAAIRRNVAIAVFGVLAGAAYVTGAVHQVDTAEAAGAAAVMLSPLAAWTLLRSARQAAVAPRGGR